jgi:hypothetical protein
MVSGHHDDGRREDGVGEGRPSPPRPEHVHDRGGHDDRPGNVHRWHGRELVQPGPGGGRVDGGPDQPADVDHTGPGHQTRGRHGHEGDEQAGARGQRQGVADHRITVPVAGEHPDEAGTGDHDVKHHVVDVEATQEPVERQERALDRSLAGDVEPPLGGQELTPPAHRPTGLPQREATRQLPEGVEPEHDRELSCPRACGAGPPAGPTAEGGCRRGGARRGVGGFLPGQPLHASRR